MYANNFHVVLLQMLNNDYSYRDAANLLDAVKQLLSHFLKYTSIPMICEIKDKLDEIQTDLRKHVHRAFREIGQVRIFISSHFYHLFF